MSWPILMGSMIFIAMVGSADTITTADDEFMLHLNGRLLISRDEWLSP